MKTKITGSPKAHLIRGAFYLVLLLAGALLVFFPLKAPATASQRTLTFAERIEYQRAIEEVYWHHRIWPKENLNAKPSLDVVMSQAQLDKKVEDYVRKSQALEDCRRPITSEQLQAEMNRMARDTKQPEVLRELFEALGNDPFAIAECLARPTLVERDFATTESHIPSPETLQVKAQIQRRFVTNANYTLPTISDAATGCSPDTWTSTTTTHAPPHRVNHTAVWTGTEMIVWGGFYGMYLNTGGKYTPATDSWMATTTTNAPAPRYEHATVWSGSEMIVWGGVGMTGGFNTGGRYNPSTDSWTATSTTNVPSARFLHTAVWSGSEMIVWGGFDENFAYTNSGGKYNPSIDSWTTTSTTGAPFEGDSHRPQVAKGPPLEEIGA